MVGYHSKRKLKIVLPGKSAKVLSHYQSSKLPRLSSLLPPPRQIKMAHISNEFPIPGQDLGRSGNIEIPDRLGFSCHMKTRLKTFRLLFRCSTTEIQETRGS